MESVSPRSRRIFMEFEAAFLTIATPGTSMPPRRRRYRSKES